MITVLVDLTSVVVPDIAYVCFCTVTWFEENAESKSYLMIFTPSVSVPHHKQLHNYLFKMGLLHTVEKHDLFPPWNYTLSFPLLEGPSLASLLSGVRWSSYYWLSRALYTLYRVVATTTWSWSGAAASSCSAERSRTCEIFPVRLILRNPQIGQIISWKI